MKIKVFSYMLFLLLLSLIAVPTMAQDNEGKDISLRANLLRWATLTPDVGLELKSSNGWGAVVSGSYAHWSWDNKNRHYGLWEASAEARRYLGAKERGYLGLQAKIGQFNYKLSDTGKQGDFMGGGLTGGYKLPLGKRFALDFTVGAGYLYVMDLEKYTVVEGVRVFQDSKRNKGYWGISNLGVVLSYEL